MKALISVVLFFSLSSNLFPQNSKVLNVPYHNQTTKVWCWAASLTMVLDFEFNQYNDDCTIVTDFLRGNGYNIDCCRNRLNCALRGAYPDEIYEYLNRYTNYSYQKYGRIDFEDVKSSIDNNHPILICYSQYNNRGQLVSGHAVVIVGYNETDDFQKIKIYDPFSGVSWKKYSGAINLGSATWDISFVKN